MSETLWTIRGAGIPLGATFPMFRALGAVEALRPLDRYADLLLIVIDDSARDPGTLDAIAEQARHASTRVPDAHAETLVGIADAIDAYLDDPANEGPDLFAACIHRGADDIGGSCVELSVGHERLIIDLGLPLDVAPDAATLPPTLDLTGGPLSVVISHGHPDHWGMAPRLPTDVPVVMGRRTADILREAAFFGPGHAFKPAAYLEDRAALALGPFTVTPYLVDHSAFDAYALLIEARGRRLFYTGDLRMHGRRCGLVEDLIADPPQDVDVLLLEGTNVRPGTGATRTEQDVEDAIAAALGETSGLGMVCYSPQNVDRLISLHRAARRTGRTLLLDLYAATIAAAADDPAVPSLDDDNVAVYVPNAQRARVKRTQQFHRVNAIRRHRVFLRDVASRPERYLLTFRASMRDEIARAVQLDGARCIWSMWHGYLDNDAGQTLTGWLEDHRVALDVEHASGHAQVADLERLAEAMTAARVIPIHTRHPELYPDHFDLVVHIPDGQWWRV